MAARHRIGRLEEIPEGRASIVRVGEMEIGVIKSGERVYAVRNRCPHQGAPLARGQVSGTMLPSAPGELIYGLENEVIRCPWHGYEFELESGRSVCGTFPARIQTFITAVEDGVIWVDLGSA